jgi:hypothetical protein
MALSTAAFQNCSRGRKAFSFILMLKKGITGIDLLFYDIRMKNNNFEILLI